MHIILKRIGQVDSGHTPSLHILGIQELKPRKWFLVHDHFSGQLPEINNPSGVLSGITLLQPSCQIRELIYLRLLHATGKASAQTHSMQVYSAEFTRKHNSHANNQARNCTTGYNTNTLR